MPGEPLIAVLSWILANANGFFSDLRLSKTLDLFSELPFYADFGQDAVTQI